MTVQELNSLLGEKIIYYRKKRGWTQAKLANKAGISASILSCFEHGKYLPGGKSLILISSALGIEVWQLFYKDKQ